MSYGTCVICKEKPAGLLNYCLPCRQKAAVAKGFSSPAGVVHAASVDFGMEVKAAFRGNFGYTRCGKEFGLREKRYVSPSEAERKKTKSGFSGEVTSTGWKPTYRRVTCKSCLRELGILKHKTVTYNPRKEKVVVVPLKG